MESDGKKNITIADVAQALNVSKTTVSRAISGKGRIGEATRSRVLSYIEEHDYRPNLIAKGLAQSKTYNVCVVMPEHYGVSELTFFQDCLFGIEKVSGAAGYDVLLSICDNQDISSLARVIDNRKADGVILMCSFVKDAQVEFLQERGIPFVTTGSSDYPGVVQIDHDHRSACREMTDALLKKGLERIALIGGNETHMVTRMRLAGFLDAYLAAGKEADAALQRLGLSGASQTGGAVRELISLHADAILCMDDALANYVLRTLWELDVRVPEQMRLASFYNGSLLENHVPPVTAISFDARELGMAACRTLLDMLDGVQVQQVQMLPYEIVSRESTMLPQAGLNFLCP